MIIWPSSWNWKIVLVAVLLGGASGTIVGARRSAALLQSGALPTNSVEGLAASPSDGRVFTVLYGILGASVALTILAPPLAVATVFQAREMAVHARLKSHDAMQRAFPGASPTAVGATNSSAGARTIGLRTERST